MAHNLDLSSVTVDFIEAFPSKQECTGAMARIIATGNLPEGVNPNDERVKQIIQWSKENYPTE